MLEIVSGIPYLFIFSGSLSEHLKKSILLFLPILGNERVKFFFSSSINVKIIQDLIGELEIQDYTVKHSDGIFSNKKLMFTGGFKNMSRSEAKSITENNGGKVLGSVSKKLDFLVVGESKPTKKKIDLAKKLNVQILSENEWNKILNR